jgi:effector-binding domain-containing protein
MSRRFALCLGMAAATAAIMLAPAALRPSWSQTPPPEAPASQTPAPQTPAPQTPAPQPPASESPSPATGPAATPNPPAPSAPQALTPAPGEPFGEDVTLTAQTIVYVKGSGTWDNAFATISGALRKDKAYLEKEGLKADGQPMTIFTATDDTGFDYEAAIPIAEPPKNPPRGEIALGKSPEGHALKFVHNGSYDDLDNTYEAIGNYLDTKRLEARDTLIEQYVTDPISADPGKLTVNVYVLLK